MEPVRAARNRLRLAAAEELNCEIGTEKAVAAAAERAVARAQLASAILKAGGSNDLAEFVRKGPLEEVGTAVPQRAAAVAAGPSDRASRMRVASVVVGP